MTQPLDTPNAAAARVLQRAAELVKQGWTQGAFARNAAGNEVDGRSVKAVCFCIAGALGKANRLLCSESLSAYDECWSAIAAAIQDDFVTAWNDAPERTQVEVVNALLAAAAKLESEISE